MKKYLFGLGAMLVGAGLMFLLFHVEVQAAGVVSGFDCSLPTEYQVRNNTNVITHCRVGNVSCAISHSTVGGSEYLDLQSTNVAPISCVATASMFQFNQ